MPPFRDAPITVVTGVDATIVSKLKRRRHISGSLVAPDVKNGSKFNAVGIFTFRAGSECDIQW
jgi:hypothetical protein